MDTNLQIHNTHQTNSADYFGEHDPQLQRLAQFPYRYTFPLLHQLPDTLAGIYTIGGGRQIGKTTLVKQWMLHLLKNKQVDPQQVFFLTGDIIDIYHQLIEKITQLLADKIPGEIFYLAVDEITYIKDWDRGIKFLADAGLLDSVVLLLTGSDLVMMQEARMRFPGRRGSADQVDFQLYPLSFAQYLKLFNAFDDIDLSIQNITLSPAHWATLETHFSHYLQHGGYLTAINDISRFGEIQRATLQTYSDWIRGDCLKRGKQEQYLKEILSAVIKHQGSQMTWHTIAKTLSIDHHKTVGDYLTLLENMGAIHIQYALLEDKRAPAPKKARKLYFSDPFVYHAIKAWLSPSSAPMIQINQDISSPELSSLLVETAVLGHFKRHHPTFYLKGQGDVDIAYLAQDQFWPIELKWRNQIRPGDLKQLAKYPNGRLWTKGHTYGEINGIPVEPLLLALVCMG